MPMARHASACPHDCPSTCALDIAVEDGRVVGVRGTADHPYTAGVICAKVSRYAERIAHPHRLLHPMLRTGPKGSGQFARIGWTEALDRVADAFATATTTYGAEAVWPYQYAGTMGAVQLGGIHRLRHAMGYSRQRGTICSTIAEMGWRAGVGRITGPDPREMAVSDLIVVWGGNPVNTQVNVMTHVARARKARGAKLVVVDPYRTGTAQTADLHLMLRPGTDAALACAVMHVAFRDGHADRAFMARYADDPTALEAHVATRSPAWASGITGLTVEEIEQFAALYGRTERAYIRVGYGFTRARNGAVSMHAVTCLPTVTGKWAHEGGGAFWDNGDIYHLDRSLIQGLDLRDLSVREMDMSRIGVALTGHLTGDRSELGDGPPVVAMLIQNTNPAVVAPNSRLVNQGFNREDLFVAVHEQFMTDTARLADVILPATMFVEHDDFYKAGGHSSILLGPKLVEPPGECRSNHEVIVALAARLGAEHPGFHMTALELADATLRASGWPGVEALRDARWIDAQGDFAASHFVDGFGHPDHKFHFRADWAALGPHHHAMPALPDWLPADEATAKMPFRLVTAPARQYLNTSFTESAEGQRREGRPTAMINPVDATTLGVAEGALVRLGNGLGEVVLWALPSERAKPGTVIVESLWPNTAFVGGIGINALTSDEPAGPAGGAVFHDTAVWVRADTAHQSLTADTGNDIIAFELS